MTKEELQQLAHMLDRYLVEHCISEKTAHHIAKARHAIRMLGERMVGLCPWCGEEYTKPHPQCQIKRNHKQDGNFSEA